MSMAYKGYEVDAEYADQGYVKIYFDFDTEHECERFAEWAEDNWDEFNELVGKFEEVSE